MVPVMPAGTHEPAHNELDGLANRALKVMNAGLMVGEAMLRSRVATSEVESAVRRLNNAFGFGRIEVSVTMSEIILSLMDPRLGAPMTAVKVIDIGEIRLDLLVEFESLIAQVESGFADLDTTVAELERIATAPPPRPWWVNSLFYLLTVAAWVVFVGGGLAGALAGVAGAVIIQAVVVPLSRARLPEVFATAASAALAVAAPATAAYLDFPVAMTPAIVGGLFPLLPGGALVASVTDGLSGAPLSSIAKGLQAAVTAVAVALGALGALTLVDALEIVSPADGVATPPIIVGASAAVAVTAIALSRSMPLKLAPGTAVTALAAWAVIWLMPPGPEAFPTGSFVAAMVIGASGQIIARIARTSASLYTTTSVFVLVPGFATYLAMAAFADGDTDTGIELLVRALTISGAIAAGVTLGVAVSRSVPVPRPRVRPWTRLQGQ